jgi:hypothetical protein
MRQRVLTLRCNMERRVVVFLRAILLEVVMTWIRRWALQVTKEAAAHEEAVLSKE